MIVVEHLWQSTLCAVLAALLVLALPRSSARTRHAIWLVASLKFLVPLSLVVAAGRIAGAWLSTFAVLPGSSTFRWLDQSLGFLRIDATPSSDSTTGAVLVGVLAAAWMCGTIALAVRRVVEWRGLWAVTRQASPLSHGREVEALTRAGVRFPQAAGVPIVQHASRAEPGVLGVVRPTLVWPAGLSGRLSNAELDAIVMHEACHVQRRDNLASLVHVAIETIFWFHPMVWWIGTRLVAERERACDEEVLEMGADNRSYAEGIVKVCGFCLRAPAAFVAGVSGAGLNQRVEEILLWRRTRHSLLVRLLPLLLVLVTTGVSFGAGAAARVGAHQEKEQVEKPGNGVTLPRIVREVKPEYTIEAKRAKIQGSVWLLVVVLKDGNVGDVAVTKSLDQVYGLDDEAVKAMKQWTFTPGMKDNKPVAVQVEVEMTFTLK